MTLQELAQQWPAQVVPTAGGDIAYRRAGQGPLLVLLHGIGSGSGSWLRQLQTLQSRYTVLAWDAPGYGQSTPVGNDWPTAADYGARVWQWLQALGLAQQPIRLAGHSLGCLMAAAAVA